MKNKILIFVFMAVGAVMLSTTDGYSRGAYADCQTVRECADCHVSGGSGEDKGTFTFCESCPSDPTCDTTPTPTCKDNDGDGYGNPGSSSCPNGAAEDCDDNDGNVHPGGYELCADNGIDNDCNGQVDCKDRDCEGDTACLLASCSYYEDRGSCKTDPLCNWSGKEKLCDEIPAAQLACQEDGGRWNKKKGGTCTNR